MVTISAVEIASQPKNFLLGTAMGQFGSRAAMISSGEYLSMALPKPLVGESEYYRQYMLPPLHEYNAHGEDSAMSQPCYTMMNLVVEMGVPLTFLLLVGVTLQFLSELVAHANYGFPFTHGRAVGKRRAGVLRVVLRDRELRRIPAGDFPARPALRCGGGLDEYRRQAAPFERSWPDGESSREATMVRVLVVGQTPPPLNGQGIMIERLVNSELAGVEMIHVRMAFSSNMDELGRIRISKILHLFSLIAQIIYRRFVDGVRILYYPPAGPERVPVFATW